MLGQSQTLNYKKHLCQMLYMYVRAILQVVIKKVWFFGKHDVAAIAINQNTARLSKNASIYLTKSQKHPVTGELFVNGNEIIRV